MDEALVVDRIGWCRGSARHRYLGTLWASSDRIRLVGRDATFGIEVSLSIPLDEVEQIEVEDSRTDPSHAESRVVLTLAGSAPILVWRVGADDVSLSEVAAVLVDRWEAVVGRPFAAA